LRALVEYTPGRRMVTQFDPRVAMSPVLSRVAVSSRIVVVVVVGH